MTLPAYPKNIIIRKRNKTINTIQIHWRKSNMKKPENINHEALEQFFKTLDNTEENETIEYFREDDMEDDIDYGIEDHIDPIQWYAFCGEIGKQRVLNVYLLNQDNQTYGVYPVLENALEHFKKALKDTMIDYYNTTGPVLWTPERISLQEYMKPGNTDHDIRYWYVSRIWHMFGGKEDFIITDIKDSISDI